jgi:hypothetical protein
VSGTYLFLTGLNVVAGSLDSIGRTIGVVNLPAHRAMRGDRAHACAIVSSVTIQSSDFAHISVRPNSGLGA